MKIVIATPLYPPETGGPATYVKLLEDGLPPLGIDVSVVKFRDVRHLPSGVRHLVYFFRVLAVARSADLVYALDAVSAGFPAMLAAKFARKPFVVKIVGDFAWEQGRQRFGITQTLDQFVGEKNIPVRLKMFRWIQKCTAQNAKCIVVPSNYLNDIVTNGWTMEDKKIITVWNAIREEPPGSVPRKEIEALAKPIVVSVGRLVPWKGFKDLITAIGIVRARGVATSLVIIGDGPERNDLENQAKNELKEGYVLSGTLPHGQVLAAMNEASIFVLDSIYEGMSHVLIEALSSSACIIASDIDGNREIIEHEKNGLLVPPGNPQALADAIQRVLSEPSLSTQFTNAAKETSSAFSKEKMLQTIANEMRRLKL